VITVLIDLVASFAMENADDFSKPVVEILFKELTVLGCIALLVFMSVKTGIPEEISTSVSPCTRAYHIIHPYICRSFRLAPWQHSQHCFCISLVYARLVSKETYTSVIMRSMSCGA
jgi:hypothetical protein